MRVILILREDDARLIRRILSLEALQKFMGNCFKPLALLEEGLSVLLQLFFLILHLLHLSLLSPPLEALSARRALSFPPQSRQAADFRRA